MTLRAKVSVALPLTDGFGMTAVQDEHGVWRLASVYRGLDTIAIDISAEDRTRGFRSAEGVADYFRRRYAWQLS